MTDNLDELKRNPAMLRVFTSRVQLRHDGREYVGTCPFHTEKTGSFKVYLADDGTYLYQCFGCNARGNALQFVQNFDHVQFPEAKRRVEEFIKNSFSSTRNAEQVFKPVGQQKKEFITIPLEKYVPLEKALAESTEAQEFLKKRGISYETAKKFRLGMRRSMGKLGGTENSDIADKGWLSIPFFNMGRVVGIKYRSLSKKAFTRQPGMATGLYNLETVDALEPVLLVEGEFDAIVLEQSGLKSISLPSASTTLTPKMREEILEADSVFLAGDTDPVGAQKMQKLWAELGERVFLLRWPVPMKDANQTFLEVCGGDVGKFRTLVTELMAKAKSEPMPNMYSLSESMASSDRVNLSEHPLRMRFPWKSIDTMANLLPGGVLSFFATQTGQGKTSFIMNVLVPEARRGEVILNYSAELTTDEYSNIVAAHVLKKHRNHLTLEDYKLAAKMLGNVQFYIGRNPDLQKADQVLDLIEAGIRRFGVTIAVLDHIHYITRNESDTIKAQENAMQRIKNMAVKYGLKFIVVGQPRKANQQTRGKVVHITDTKGSEAINSDADVVMALHRNAVRIDPTNPPKDTWEPQTEIHLKKGRSMGDGNSFAILYFDGPLATFYELTSATPPADKQLFGNQSGSVV